MRLKLSDWISWNVLAEEVALLGRYTAIGALASLLFQKDSSFGICIGALVLGCAMVIVIHSRQERRAKGGLHELE